MKHLQKYIERLYKEWIGHNRIIVAVDWDDTLSPWKLNSKEECLPVWDLLKKVRATGAYITIFTACKENRYDEIRKDCKLGGLEIDSINKNPIDLPYGNTNKIYANIFLDDRAGLQQAMDILETTMYKVRGRQEQEKLLNLGEL